MLGRCMLAAMLRCRCCNAPPKACSVRHTSAACGTLRATVRPRVPQPAPSSSTCNRDKAVAACSQLD
jgi:hypothetical protein